MKLNMDSIQKKVLPVANKLSRNKYLKAVSDGLSTILPATIVGAIFTLINCLPITAYQDFLTSSGVGKLLNLVPTFTINAIALYGAFFIAQRLAENFDQDGTTAALLSVIAFLIVTPFEVLENGSFLPLAWMGAQGLFVAIILALVTSRIYVLIMEKGLVIKMPKGVPPTVAKSFAGLIPGFIIAIIAIIINGIFSMTSFGNMHEFIYHFIQTPLESLGGSFGGMITAVLIGQVLWLLGIHGSMIIFNVMLPIWLSLDAQNLAAFQAGEPLPNIIGLAFVAIFAQVGGSGSTLGLNILMSFRAKSQRYKTLGKLSLVPSICGINEPMIFGTPMILNPLMAIPFLITPVICSGIAYLTMATGIVPKLMGTLIPTGTPIIISGFMEGSWKIAILQIVLTVVTVICYYPFFKIADKQAYDLELKAEESK